MSAVPDGSVFGLAARVLGDDFIPAEVVHRDTKIQHLSRVLDPLTQGEPAGTLLVTESSDVKPVSRSSLPSDAKRPESLL